MVTTNPPEENQLRANYGTILCILVFIFSGAVEKDILTAFSCTSSHQSIKSGSIIADFFHAVMLNLFQHPLLSLSSAVEKGILDCKRKGCHFHRYRLTQGEKDAEGGTRTRTGKNPRDFKSLASTGSATSAFGDEEQTQVKFYYFWLPPSMFSPYHP